MRVDYANTLGVYTIQYAQCNSNYGSIGGTTSVKRRLCAGIHVGGRRVEDVDRISFHQRSGIFQLRNMKHHLPYMGNDNEKILETVLDSRIE